MTDSMLASTMPPWGVALTQKALKVRNMSLFDDVIEGDVLGFDIQGLTGSWTLDPGSIDSVWSNVIHWRLPDPPGGSPLMVDCGIPVCTAKQSEPVKIGQIFNAWLWHPDITVHFHHHTDTDHYPGEHGIVHAIPMAPPDHRNLGLEWTGGSPFSSGTGFAAARGTRNVARNFGFYPTRVPYPSGGFSEYIPAIWNGWEEMWTDNGA